MNWLEAITELCKLVNVDSTVKDILLTGVGKGLITLEQGRKIAADNDCESTPFSQLRRKC